MNQATTKTAMDSGVKPHLAHSRSALTSTRFSAAVQAPSASDETAPSVLSLPAGRH